jgi:hypothetical protein
MESLKYLAWHLIYACDERQLYEKLGSAEWSDRKSFIQWVNSCLRHGKPIKSILTQQHLDELSTFLMKAGEQQWKNAYFDFAWYILIFGNEKVRGKLDVLEDHMS